MALLVCHHGTIFEHSHIHDKILCDDIFRAFNCDETEIPRGQLQSIVHAAKHCLAQDGLISIQRQ